VQRGVRFAIRLAPGHTEARGYITEIWGSIWELPDLGPLGGHGLANPRDFLHPVAYIDDELHGNWTIVNKSNGKYNAIEQDHSPFDLLAWHGNVVPYKVCSSSPFFFSSMLSTDSVQYDLTKFASQNATSIDHTDPSVNCVLTAKSRDPNTPLADFLWFGPRWDVASNSFRLPYFHRNSATEFLASLYGKGLGRSDDFLPGGGSVEVSHTPHGGFNEGYQYEMRIQENEPRRILESKPTPRFFFSIFQSLTLIYSDQMTIMLESSRSFLFTEYARGGCGTFRRQGTEPKVWDALPVSNPLSYS
jgi:homogentisate 1,2-dioxygenase